MGAAIEQNVTHLVTNAPVAAKDIKSTKEADAQDNTFRDLMTREDEDAAPEKNAKEPQQPVLRKEKLQDASTAKEVVLVPQDASHDLETAPLEDIGFPKIWAGKASKEEAPQKGDTVVLADVETLGSRLEKKPLEDTVVTRTAKTQETPEPSVQLFEEADTQEVVEVPPPPAPMIQTQEPPQKTALIQEETPPMEKDAPRPQEEKTMDRQVLLEDEALVRDDMDEVDMDQDAPLVPKSASSDVLEKEALRVESPSTFSKKERDLNGAQTGRTSVASSDVGGRDKGAPEALEVAPSLELSALLESSDHTVSPTHLGGSKGEGVSFMAGGARGESLSHIMLQREAPLQESAQQTLMRTPSYTLVQVDVKMPSLQESGTLKMRLDPGHLGRVEVEVTLTHDGRLDAVVNVSKTETFEMMRHDSDALARVIADAFGGELGTLDFSLSQENQDNAPLFDGAPRARSDPQEPALSQAVLAFQTQQLDPARMLDALA